MKYLAYAKINIRLNVLEKKENNYHDLYMLNAKTTLCDEIEIIKTSYQPESDDKSFVFRLCFSVLLLTAIISFFLYVLKITGFWEKVNSVNDVRNFIVSLGGYAVLTFIIMQIFIRVNRFSYKFVIFLSLFFLL